jgi:hypothetical protein
MFGRLLGRCAHVTPTFTRQRRVDRGHVMVQAVGQRVRTALGHSDGGVTHDVTDPLERDALVLQQGREHTA